MIGLRRLTIRKMFDDNPNFSEEIAVSYYGAAH